MCTGAAYKVLKEACIQIYERGADVGGTWRVSLRILCLRVYDVD